MFILMNLQPKGEALYKEPLTRSIDATYQGSELKRMVDSGTTKITHEYPVLIGLGVIGYGIGVKRQVNFATTKYSPILSTRLSLLATKNQVYTSIKWEF